MANILSISLNRELPIPKVVVFLILVSVSRLSIAQPVNLRAEIPYGIRSGRGVVVQGQVFSSLVAVESFSQENFDIELEITLPENFEPVNIPRDIIPDKQTNRLLCKFSLVTEFDLWYRLIDIYIPPDVPSGLYDIGISCTSDKISIQEKFSVRVITAGDAENFIKIKGVNVPSNSEGELEMRYGVNTFVAPGTNNLLSRLFTRDAGSHAAATYARIEIANEFDEDAIVHASINILDTNTGRRVSWLLLPHCDNEVTAIGEGEIYTQAYLKGKGEAVVVLPVSVDEYKIAGGDYILRTRVRLFGTDSTIHMLEQPLKVVSRNYASLTMTGLTLVITIVWFIVGWRKKDVIFRDFKSKHLVLAGLFGATTFAVTTVPSVIFTNIVRVVLGPFSFFITGIFSEIILYMLLLSLVTLVPRVGIISLVTMMRFLLSGIIFGHFNLQSLLWYTSTAFILESLLYLFGIITMDGKKTPQNSTSVLIRTGLCCGIADAFISLLFLNLSMCLYRLYYAGWYILMYVTIPGFLYTAVSAPLGIILGNKLKRTSLE